MLQSDLEQIINVSLFSRLSVEVSPKEHPMQPQLCQSSSPLVLVLPYPQDLEKEDSKHLLFHAQPGLFLKGFAQTAAAALPQGSKQ